eukprot:tig00000093_g3602.t1
MRPGQAVTVGGDELASVAAALEPARASAPAAAAAQASISASAAAHAGSPNARGAALDDLPDELLARVIELVGMREALCRARLWAVSARFARLLRKGVSWADSGGRARSLNISVFVLDPLVGEELQADAAAAQGAGELEALARAEAAELEVLGRAAARGLLPGPWAVALDVEAASPFFVGTAAAPALARLLEGLRAHDAVERLSVEFASAHVPSLRRTGEIQRGPSVSWPSEILACVLTALRGSKALRTLEYAPAGFPGVALDARIAVEGAFGVFKQWRALLSRLPSLTCLRLPPLEFQPEFVAAVASALPRLQTLALGTYPLAGTLEPLAGLASLADLSVRTLSGQLPTLTGRISALPAEGPLRASLRALRLQGVLGPEVLASLPGYTNLESLEILSAPVVPVAVPLVANLARLTRLSSLGLGILRPTAGLLEALAAAVAALPALNSLSVSLGDLAFVGNRKTAALAAAGRSALRSWTHTNVPAPLSLEEAQALAGCERLERVCLRHWVDGGPVPRAAFGALGRLAGAEFGRALTVLVLGGKPPQAEEAGAELAALLPHADVRIFEDPPTQHL